MITQAIAIFSAVLTTLLSVIVGLIQMHWRATLAGLDERYAYQRTKLDDTIAEHNQHALQLAKFDAANSALMRRLESIEEDMQVFRRELINISQACVRIETQIRKSTPPPRGG